MGRVGRERGGTQRGDTHRRGGGGCVAIGLIGIGEREVGCAERTGAVGIGARDIGEVPDGDQRIGRCVGRALPIAARDDDLVRRQRACGGRARRRCDGSGRCWGGGGQELGDMDDRQFCYGACDFRARELSRQRRRSLGFVAALGSSPARRRVSAASRAGATAGVAIASASSSSSSLARPNSLANGLTAGRSLLATSVSTLIPALRAASSELSDGVPPRF